jgi:hypothetical protein
MPKFTVDVIGKVLVTGDNPEHARSIVDEILKEKYSWLRTGYNIPEKIQDVLELEVNSLNQLIAN